MLRHAWTHLMLQSVIDEREYLLSSARYEGEYGSLSAHHDLLAEADRLAKLGDYLLKRLSR